jgi:nucleotide-binding universal stress UspA family protein
MATSEPRERADTIVVGTDGSESAERAVREASWLARSTGSRLLIVSAVSDLHPYREHIESTAREDLVHLGEVADQLLIRAAAEAEGDHVEIETASREGDPAKVLSDIAAEEHARLVISAFLRSSRIMRRAACSSCATASSTGPVDRHAGPASNRPGSGWAARRARSTRRG